MIHYINFGNGEHSFQLKMHVVAQSSWNRKVCVQLNQRFKISV